MNNNLTWDNIKLFLPLAIFELILIIVCLVILKKSKVKHLPKWAWALIIIFGELFGSIIFLVIGREKD